ncbi:MAG: flavodoxin [Lachnospiraceae bacterium]|nr:flavodoxin [Lachnospiraceae bacterium]
MRKVTTALLCAFVLLAFAGCNGNTQKTGDFSFHDNSAQSTQNQNGTEQNNPGQDDVYQSAADSKQEEDSKTLIAYFSRVGNTDFPAGADVTASASLIVKDGGLYGNTQYIATMIQRATGGDLFLIETEEKYPADYDATGRQGAKESKEKSRPELASHIENINEYDTVYLGFPNWYYGMPMAVYSFLEEYNLSGKTIIPFVTSGGSGFSDTIPEIQSIQPDATVLSEGFKVTHSKVSDVTFEDVEEWINSLNK